MAGSLPESARPLGAQEALRPLVSGAYLCVTDEDGALLAAGSEISEMVKTGLLEGGEELTQREQQILEVGAFAGAAMAIARRECALLGTDAVLDRVDCALPELRKARESEAAGAAAEKRRRQVALMVAQIKDGGDLDEDDPALVDRSAQLAQRIAYGLVGGGDGLRACKASVLDAIEGFMEAHGVLRVSDEEGVAGLADAISSAVWGGGS